MQCLLAANSSRRRYWSRQAGCRQGRCKATGRGIVGGEVGLLLGLPEYYLGLCRQRSRIVIGAALILFGIV
jgi:hypothetical protein